jgi:GH25 family lysozyme M1 (1,4-beta-N-acetylmuramidase)
MSKEKKTVLLGVTGGIAAYKTAYVASGLKKKGYDVIIYTNKNGYDKYYEGMLGDCDLWLCSFTSPDLLNNLPHRFQQFSHEGKVMGIDGDVDLNVFRGSRKEWSHYLDQVKQPE